MPGLPTASSSTSLSVSNSLSSPGVPLSISLIGPSSSTNPKALAASVISALLTKDLGPDSGSINKSTVIDTDCPVGIDAISSVLLVQAGSTFIIPTGGVSVTTTSVASSVP